MTDEYVGPTPVSGTDIALKSYVDAWAAQNLTSTQVTNRINSDLSGYETTSAATSLLNTLETTSQFNTDNGNKAKIANIGAASNMVALDSSGQIAATALSLLTPSSSPPGAVRMKILRFGSYAATSTNGGTVASLSIPDPGWKYNVLVWGNVEAQGTGGTGTSTNIGRPEIWVKVNGVVVAYGAGRADNNFHPIVVHPYNLPASPGFSGAQTATATLHASPSIGGGTVNVATACNSQPNLYYGLTALIVPYHLSPN